MRNTRTTWVGACMAGLLLLGQAGRLSAATFYVATDGDDRWSGRLERPNAQRTDGPLASLDGARRAVRQAKGQLPATEAIQVLVAGGTYSFRDVLVFSPEDSGSLQRPIVYEAAPGASVVVSGGRKIQGFQAGPDGVWTVRIPEVASGKWYFEQLYVNGRRAIRARSPNQFYYYMRSAVPAAVDPATGKFGRPVEAGVRGKGRGRRPTGVRTQGATGRTWS